MQIRPKLDQTSKILKKGRKKICGQTTFENDQIFAIWPQKVHVPKLT